jgi:uncharacterized protein (DUF736 family)
MKNLMLFKNQDKKTESQPDYRLVATIEGQEGMFSVGAGWIRDGSKGKFISIKLQDAREFEYEGVKKTAKGYKLVEEGQQVAKVQEVDEIDADSIPF